MAAKGSKQIWIRLRSQKPPHDWFVDPNLLPRMVEDAADKGTNLTDLGLQILCSYFQVPYTPNVRRSTPTADKDVLNFGVFPELDRALRARSALAGLKPMDYARYALCTHYGLRIPPKRKLTRRRVARAA